MTIRTLLCILLSATTLFAVAEDQKGYVKTKGRLNANGQVIPGDRLQGASIVVRGRGAVLSGANGTFKLASPGNRFFLQKVQKQGYVLSDPDLLTRQIECSPTPLVLVLETPESQIEDKLEAMEKIQATLQRQLTQSRAQIKRLRAEQKISLEEYQKRLSELSQIQGSNDKLVDEMAEHYSRIDYDQLDEFNRRISECILNGRLTEADSLLRSKGDINARIEANLREQEAYDQARRQLDKREALIRKGQMDIGQDCYSKFEIFKIQHQNDSAAFYIEQRSRLDTTNIQWLIDAGEFLHGYKADYKRARQYYDRALLTARQQGNRYLEAGAYNDIAVLLMEQAQYKEALPTAEKALNLLREEVGDDHERVAIYTGNIGSVYWYMKDFAKALEYHQQALDINLRLFGENHLSTAQCYGNIGSTEQDLGHYDKAEEYLQKGLQITLRLFGEQHREVATAYNNLGALYFTMADYKKAQESLRKSLETCISLYGEQHPLTTTGYNNLGTLLFYTGNQQEGFDFFKKAHEINIALLGELSEAVYTDYTNLAGACSNMNKLEEALEYAKKALYVGETIYGADSPGLQATLQNLGTAYINLGQTDKAIEYLGRNITNLKTNHLETTPSYAETLDKLGKAYAIMGNYERAESYYDEALECYTQTLGERHPWVGQLYSDMGKMRNKQGRYAEAFDYCERAVDIYKDHPNTADREMPLLTQLIKNIMVAASQKDIKAGRLKQRYEALKASYPNYFTED